MSPTKASMCAHLWWINPLIRLLCSDRVMVEAPQSYGCQNETLTLSCTFCRSSRWCLSAYRISQQPAREEKEHELSTATIRGKGDMPERWHTGEADVLRLWMPECVFVGGQQDRWDSCSGIRPDKCLWVRCLQLPVGLTASVCWAWRRRTPPRRTSSHTAALLGRWVKKSGLGQKDNWPVTNKYMLALWDWFT